MSYDLDVQQAPCDHQISKERYVIDSKDFRTLHLAANTAINMRAPINGTSQVELYISGKLVNPTDPVYGYSFIIDSGRLESTSYVFYKILFNKQVRLVNPLIEVSYFCPITFCLKCNGMGQLNDLKIAANGAFLHVVQSDKLVQKSLKFILTSTCPFYPQFTCPIKNYLGKKFGVTITDADIGNAIVTSLLQIQSIQNSQRTIQTLDPLETLKDVTNVVAVTDPTDPTRVNVTAQVSSYGTTTTQTIGFSLTTTKSAQYYSPGGNG